jgi:hypothetical protein
MYINTSGELTSSLGNSGTAAAILRVADNSLVLSKRFVSGPVLPGGNVILRYTIENRPDVFTVVQIAFSDDLDQALTGLARVSTESVNSCGSAVVITGTTTLTFGNGSLPPGAICVFDILVAVPADAVAASYPGASSAVTASAGGVAIAGSAASADLVVAFPDFAKTFTAIAEVGGSVDLVFTIGNPDPVNAATGLTFSDDLEQMGTDFTAPGLPLSNVCGTGSLLSGSRRIVLTAGSVAAGASCQFSVTVNLPASADSGTFVNVTSPLDFIVNGQNITGNQTGAATASLEVVTELVEVPLLNGWVLLLCALIMASAGAFRLRRRQ